ncbi:MAG: hypothetical protein IPG06_25075 [Haliea sp.]|nr:hypothetical protein [Haliea sp.]
MQGKDPNIMLFALPLDIAAGPKPLEQANRNNLTHSLLGEARHYIVLYFTSVKGRKVNAIINEVVKCDGEAVEFQLVQKIEDHHHGLIVVIQA